MTRETKIGLLVGLMFIVVFAVLLSHTGSTPPHGDGLPIASAERKSPIGDAGGSMTDGQRATPEAHPSNPSPLIDSGSPQPSPVVTPVASRHDDAPDGTLPSPGVLQPLPDEWTRTPPGDVAAVPPSTGTEGSPTILAVNDQRKAPPLPSDSIPVPAATPRDIQPTVTTPPDGIELVSNHTEQPDLHPAQLPQAPPKEYLVHKGETLGQIAGKVYGTSSTKVVDFLMKSNKGTLKSKDFVVEGQTLVTPTLPSDQFEPVSNFSVRNMNVGAKSREVEELVNGKRPSTSPSSESRHAPAGPKSPSGVKSVPDVAPSAPKDKVADKEKTALPDKQADKTPTSYRWYEVRSKDTFGSIAKEQLGAESQWKEIQKLNKQIDPGKMRPGLKIKLPAKGAPAASSGSAKRVSA